MIVVGDELGSYVAVGCIDLSDMAVLGSAILVVEIRRTVLEALISSSVKGSLWVLLTYLVARRRLCYRSFPRSP
jgi:flagellar biosynthesis component FlhA